MNETIFVAGVLLIVAAVVGGGFALFGIAIPPLDSLRRRVFVGLVGAVLIGISFSSGIRDWCCPPSTTPTPTSTPTSTPSPTPTPTTRPEFISVVGAAPGGSASVAVRTSPGAFCSITYLTPSGTNSMADGLDSKTAGANGTASWTWTIGARTEPGDGTVTVTCGGESASSPIVIP